MRQIFIVLALLWAGHAAAEDVTPGRLSVTGVGVVDSQPDMATISMGALAQAATAAEALAETSRATAATLALLTEAGVEGRDMQTSNLSLQPVWDNRTTSGSRPRISGYQASNTVTVRVRDLEKLGGILDAVVQNGANTFQGLTFGLQDAGPVQDQARRAAVAEAMRKARLYAEAAGLTLGAVLELSESGSATPRPEMLGRMATMAEAVPVAAGEVSTQAQVTMVFALSGS
ncbi:MAG: SIMPL domain-containing protein [Rhodobacter sp.]|nr:SIMPL domain-containing protein [Rhodobacter sp.]